MYSCRAVQGSRASCEELFLYDIDASFFESSFDSRPGLCVERGRPVDPEQDLIIFACQVSYACARSAWTMHGRVHQPQVTSSCDYLYPYNPAWLVSLFFSGLKDRQLRLTAHVQ